MTLRLSRVRDLGLLLIIAGVQPACSGGILDKAGATDVPTGCDAALRQRDAGEPRCDASPQLCAQIRQDPTRRYNFVFSFWKANEDTATLKCVVDFLGSRGATANIVDWNHVPGITPGTYVTAAGSFEMVAPVLQFAVIASYLATCPSTCM